MSDLALKKQENGRYDLDFSRGDLVLTDTLENSVLLSLVCWSRDESIRDVANLNPDIGGWWGNSLEDVEIGSQLWKLFKNKLNEPTATNAVSEAKKALKWMVDDGVAKQVDAEAVIDGKLLVLKIYVVRPNSERDEFRWQINWEASI
jgi:phage gp46-like protein